MSKSDIEAEGACCFFSWRLVCSDFYGTTFGWLNWNHGSDAGRNFSVILFIAAIVCWVLASTLSPGKGRNSSAEHNQYNKKIREVTEI